MSRRETITKRVEWAVRRPDGSLFQVSTTGGQGQHDAHAQVAQMNYQAEVLRVVDYEAVAVQRVVTKSVVTTETATPWGR